MSGYIKNWKQREFLAKVSGIVADNLYQAAQYAADRARELAPKATGLMVKNIAIAVETTAQGNTIEARMGVKKGYVRTRGGETKKAPPYGYFLELGTSKMAARPFLRPAVFGHAKEIVKIIEGKG